MRLFVSKEGLKGSLGPVRAWRFYAFAGLLAAVVVSLVIGIDALTGLGTFTWNGKTPMWVEYAGLAFDGLTFSALMAFGEEYGWRGYLLPKLLPLGEVKAAVLVGAIWATWHLPILIAGLNYPGVAPLAVIAVFVPVTIAMSVLFGVSRHRCGQGESAIVGLSRIFVLGQEPASRLRVDRAAGVDVLTHRSPPGVRPRKLYSTCRWESGHGSDQAAV